MERKTSLNECRRGKNVLNREAHLAPLLHDGRCISLDTVCSKSWATLAPLPPLPQHQRDRRVLSKNSPSLLSKSYATIAAEMASSDNSDSDQGNVRPSPKCSQSRSHSFRGTTLKRRISKPPPKSFDETSKDGSGGNTRMTMRGAGLGNVQLSRRSAYGSTLTYFPLVSCGLGDSPGFIVNKSCFDIDFQNDEDCVFQQTSIPHQTHETTPSTGISSRRCQHLADGDRNSYCQSMMQCSRDNDDSYYQSVMLRPRNSKSSWAGPSLTDYSPEVSYQFLDTPSPSNGLLTHHDLFRYVDGEVLFSYV